MKFVLAFVAMSLSVSAFAAVDARDCKLTVKLDGRKGSVTKVAKSKISKSEHGEVVLFSAVKGVGGQVLIMGGGSNSLVRGVITSNNGEQGIVASLDQSNPVMELRQMGADMSVLDVSLDCTAKTSQN